ncbi:MAG: S8 family serine peptidase, partial [Planctomycetota bacterium]
ELSIPVPLRGDKQIKLWIVQLNDKPTEQARAAIRAEGGEVHGYLPEHAYVVRMSHPVAADVQRQRAVRSVTYYHPAFRLEPFLLAEVIRGIVAEKRRYNIVVVDKHRDKPGLIAKIRGLDGIIEHEQPGSLLLEASLTGAQLIQVARLDEVLWIDRWTAPELDMNNGRIQGGGNYVETKGGYTGKGINGHVYEGIEAGHSDFTNKGINVLSCGSADSHGHCTAGIIFGNGTSHQDARGMAPDAQPHYTTRTCVNSGTSRWQVVEALVKTHEVMFTSASWGGGRVTTYTSVSSSTDDIIFDHDMPWTQSQSNAGNQASRPEAWAKNIFSIGGVAHGNNANPLDDSWQAGNGSTGPAADGRIKPDLCAYYDGIMTSDLTGASGYNRSGDYYTSFGGTSGATPMVAGHNALAIQMFTDGLFSPKRVPNGTRFQNRPHFTTLKALQIANATQYAFTSTSSDNRREHVGWGFPNLQSMYDNRNVHFVVDETDLLQQGTGMAYTIRVASGQPELKVSMCYADVAGNPAATLARVNDLTLRVTAPNGSTSYWGNNGLTQGNYSVPGGQRDQRDTVENVFIKNPAAGDWKVEVAAYLVAKDTHVETPTVDADFALVVNGGVLVSKAPITISVGSFIAFGKNCLGSAKSTGEACVAFNTSNSFQTLNTRASTGYALEVTAPTALTVTGFDIRARAASNQTLATALYLPNASGVPTTIAATGSLQVTTTMGWRRISCAFATGGTTAGIPYFRLTGTTWTSRIAPSFRWAFRVNCPGGFVAPVMSSSDTPTLGQKLNITLSQALPNTTAILMIGASNTTWSGGSLPFSLAPVGGGTCVLYVSLDALLSYPTGATGSVTASLTAPTNKALLGAKAWVQYAVIDPQANPFGHVTTNAATVVLGN